MQNLFTSRGENLWTLIYTCTSVLEVDSGLVLTACLQQLACLHPVHDIYIPYEPPSIACTIQSPCTTLTFLA